MNLPKRNALGRFCQDGTPLRTPRSPDQPGILEINQQTTDNNRVGVNRSGQAGRRGAFVLVGQNGHDMNSKCKSTALHMRM
jgi:hypothetical protein